MIRKLAAASIFFIFLASITGYRLAYWWASHNAGEELEVQLNNCDYNPNDLILIHIPLNLPYHEDQTEFERVDGELEIDGIVYTYVERKVSGGQVWLKCIWNKEEGRLSSLRDDFFKTSAGLQQHSGSQKQQEKTPNLKTPVFDCDLDPLNNIADRFSSCNFAYTILHTQYLPLVYLTIAEQPPELSFS